MYTFLFQVSRPVSMKKATIQTRNRKLNIKKKEKINKSVDEFFRNQGHKIIDIVSSNYETFSENSGKSTSVEGIKSAVGFTCYDFSKGYTENIPYESLVNPSHDYSRLAGDNYPNTLMNYYVEDPNMESNDRFGCIDPGIRQSSSQYSPCLATQFEQPIIAIGMRPDDVNDFDIPFQEGVSLSNLADGVSFHFGNVATSETHMPNQLQSVYSFQNNYSNSHNLN